MQIEQKVLLLGIYKKEDDETIQDILLKLEETGIFTLKEGKKLLKELREDRYLQSDSLSFTGLQKAKEIEDEFKI